MNNYPSVLFVMPAFGGMVSDTTTVGLYKSGKELDKLGIRNSLLTVSNESLLCRGRSKLFSFFYNETNYTHMIFVDSDVGFEPNDIVKLLEVNEDFVAAGCPLKTTPAIKYNFGVIKDKNGNLIWNKEHTAFQISYVGTAFMMLTRKVFEDMAAAYPELKYVPSRTHTNRAPNDISMNNSYYFFKTEITEVGDLLGEDYSFTSRYLKTGGKIWLRPDISLSHTGSFVFTGTNLADVFKD